ncbi:glycosyltransferase family 2 protein [Candidatus Falkowbacteria bacterium]|nr:glycosyltransferase family 2 protein [Candidatus Falkowbacteria bacterium]
MDLSIIIVNYNSAAKTLACLESLKKADLQDLEVELFLVDNNSDEAVEEAAKLIWPSLDFVGNDKNLGMGAGNNVGLRRARGEYVLVLNPDTELKPGSIKTMIRYLKSDESVGLVGPKLLYPDGQEQDSCFRYPNIFLPLLRRTFLGYFAKDYLDSYLMKNLDMSKPQSVEWIMGSCLMIRKSVLDQVGFFDERFFMYLEDTDLCRRINNAGFKVVYLPTAEAIHHHGRASAKHHWLVAPFINKLSRIHLASLVKYMAKWHKFQ